jgi:ketosteroid isomerase-like protein
VDNIAEIENLEEQLRVAMLASDVEKLDLLLSDTLLFINQVGMRLTKDDDLSAHRSGLLMIEKLDSRGDRIVRPLGDTVIVCLTVDLAGKYAGQPFEGTFAYSRVWHRKHEGWQVEAGHCSNVMSPG